MAKNNKPILSVLVDEEKKERFSALAKENNYSMGWLLNQAIDKMLESGTIHIYRDSIAPTPSNIAPSTDIEELVRSYVEKAITPLSNEYVQKNSWDDLRADVADLRSKLTQLKADDGMSTASIKKLIAEAITKASIDTTTSKKPQPTAIKTTLATGEVQPEVLKVVKRLEKEPALKSAVIAGLAAGNTGENLGQYLADKGFWNSNGGKYTGASNSRFRLAIEYLNSVNNGAETNG
jgi:hypothetical protein